MGELAAFVNRHPAVIGVAVVLVALIAWMQSGSAQSGGGVTFTGGGIAPNPVDPGVVAIEQARITAGSQNISTLAELLFGEHQSADALAAAEAESSNNLTASLANTSASLSASLAQTSAQRDESLASTQASVDIASTQASAQTVAARINADTQAAIAASNAAVAKLNADNETFRIQAAKDEARAADNTSIVNGILHLGGEVLGILSFGLF